MSAFSFRKCAFHGAQWLRKAKMATQIPPELANQTAMQARTGRRSWGEEAVRSKLACAARDICINPGQGAGEVNRIENKEMLMRVHSEIAARVAGRVTGPSLPSPVR